MFGRKARSSLSHLQSDHAVNAWGTTSVAPGFPKAGKSASASTSTQSETATTHGLMAQTRVASNLGWRAVGALTVGDKVLTFDGGMQEITEVRRMTHWEDALECDRNQWPVTVPENALGNRAALTLLPDQGILVESPAASDPFGDPYAVVPATALVGVRGIRRMAPVRATELTCISFAREQVIYAEGGALIYCPARIVALDEFLSAREPCYDILDNEAAEFLAGCIIIEDQIGMPPEAAPRRRLAS